MSEDDLFSRWSRRKRQVAREEAEEGGSAPSPEATPRSISGSMEEQAPEGEDEAALLERLGLPLPETMKKGDDFSAFMAPGVPAFLRKRALRVLWGSNPVLANIDGLNDYDEDFTSPELTKKVLATGYKVGRGFLREMLAEEEEAEAVAQAGESEGEGESDAADAEAQALPEPAPVTPSLHAAEEAEEEAPAFRPRRMRFEA